jgi:ligand-binding SRPBCC domain-containing protein
MKTYLLRRQQVIPRPVDEVFAFFSDACNLEVLTPLWMNFRVRTPTPIEMQAGVLIEYTIRWRGLPLRWLTEIEEWQPAHRFVDVQRNGPYRLWHHTHTFCKRSGGTEMEDVVQYALPLGLIGTIAHALFVRRDVHAIFDYRAQRIHELMAAG